ncbi:MAG: secretion protein HlyD family protein [Gemmatimonadetes bacterium]|nr:secretion protein HlyD family protein [Gemmatimonadota bacterium]
MNTKPLFLVVALAAACSKSGAPAADSAAAPSIVLNAQDVATVEMRTVGAAVLVSGNLDPAEMVSVKAQVPGTVSGVRVDRGSSVSRGQLLATIEAQGIRSQAAGAAAQVAAARAQLSLAQQRLEASKKLYDAGAISAIEYKTAQASVEAADAQLAGARAGAAGANESAARATIVSPISGVVSARAVDGGEAVTPGADLFTIVDASELELSGRVAVQDASRIRAGQAVTFTIDGYANQGFHGRVARVDPTSDPATRQVGVFVRLPNPGRRIVGGQYARGRIETGGTTSALVVPEAAVTSRTGDSATVYAVVGNRISRRPVVVGPRDEATGLVSIVSGLRAAERVLLNPSSEVGDGTLVTVVGDRPKAPARRDSTR